MSEQKIYVPKCNAREVTFKNGGSIIKIGFHADSIAAFCKEHANQSGYVNLRVSRRREVGDRGETHCVFLDTWEPDSNKAKQQVNEPAPTAVPIQDNPPESSGQDDGSNVPF